MRPSLPHRVSVFNRRWKPVTLSHQSFPRIPPDQTIEEETTPNYVAARFYPVRIGEILCNQYQVVGKLGFGSSSTVWLARDLQLGRHVALKLFINGASMGDHVDDELNMYKRLERGSKHHPGRHAVRSLLDSFEVGGPDGLHRCLVHPPLWESVSAFLDRNPVRRLPSPVLAFILYRVFLALDYLHRECHVIHTDIKGDNIMFGIEDDSVFDRFEADELQDPCPRKVLDDRVIYSSRDLSMPSKIGAPVLCDFGSAVLGETVRTEDVQPDVYRAPEVILEVPWTYSIDIWNVGCMIWDLFEGGHLFTGYDQEFNSYRSRAHLAEIIALLGSPPSGLLVKGQLTHKFFDDDYRLRTNTTTRSKKTLEERETTLDGEEKILFLQLVRKMLQWQPEKRFSAEELLRDEWIRMHM